MSDYPTTSPTVNTDEEAQPTEAQPTETEILADALEAVRTGQAPALPDDLADEEEADAIGYTESLRPFDY